MKNYRITKSTIDTTNLMLTANGKCFDTTAEDIKMANETLKMINKINLWGNEYTISKDDEKYFKNAMRLGAFNKATKKDIANDYFITVNVA